MDRCFRLDGRGPSLEFTPMDFRKLTAVGKRIGEDDRQLNLGSNGYDHCCVLSTEGSIERPAVALYDPESGRKMEVYTTEPGVQFYSGNQLDGTITGKYEHTYQKHTALALETQHFPDSPNRPDFPSTLLELGQEYYTETVYKFSVE